MRIIRGCRWNPPAALFLCHPAGEDPQVMQIPIPETRASSMKTMSEIQVLKSYTIMKTDGLKSHTIIKMSISKSHTIMKIAVLKMYAFLKTGFPEGKADCAKNENSLKILG
ncbi:MAG: hypothetical protein K5767_03320 [Clostridia bacterium]|nr:hypothetical protein [Clostridia bacterium]